MKDFFETPIASMISLFLIGCLMMSGMKAVEWLIPAQGLRMRIIIRI